MHFERHLLAKLKISYQFIGELVIITYMWGLLKSPTA